MQRLMTLVAVLLTSGFIFAGENVYMIQCTILDGNRLVGSPSVVAEAGKQVTVSVTDTYDLALTAEEQDDGRVALSADITIGGETHSPSLLLELDRATEVRLGGSALKVTVSRYKPDDV